MTQGTLTIDFLETNLHLNTLEKCLTTTRLKIFPPIRIRLLKRENTNGSAKVRFLVDLTSVRTKIDQNVAILRTINEEKTKQAKILKTQTITTTVNEKETNAIAKRTYKHGEKFQRAQRGIRKRNGRNLPGLDMICTRLRARGRVLDPDHKAGTGGNPDRLKVTGEVHTVPTAVDNPALDHPVPGVFPTDTQTRTMKTIIQSIMVVKLATVAESRTAKKENRKLWG